MKINLGKALTTFFLTSTILYFIVSCKKGSQSPERASPEAVVLHFSQRGLEYVQLTAGMYLIYKDSANTKEDSIVVTTTSLVTKFSPAEFDYGWLYIAAQNAYYYDVLTLILSRANNTNETWFVGRADCRNSMNVTAYVNKVLSSDSLAIIMQDNDYVTSQFRFPVDNINTFYEGNMTVEGMEYKNVVKYFDSYYSGTDSSQSQTLYWAPKVGIIKWQKKNRSTVQTFTLLRHG